MDFDNLDFNELDELSVQHMIFETNELSSILKGHLFIETILETLLKRNLKNPEELLKQQLSFSLKLNLVSSLGILPNNHIGPIRALNKIRNNYAHNLNYHITIAEINQLKVEWAPIQEKAYNAAVLNKGIEDAVLLAVLFLCWSTMRCL
jgi:hypothetical protein